LEVHKIVDEMSPITENIVVVTGATDFLLESFHFEMKTFTETNNPTKDRHTSIAKLIFTKIFVREQSMP